MVLKRKQEEVLRIIILQFNRFSFQVHLLRRQMRTGRVRKTTKEMSAHYTAIQQGVCSINSFSSSNQKSIFIDKKCHSSSKTYSRN